MADALLEVGRIVKPHGLGGEVVVSLVSNRLERVAPGAELVVTRPSGTARHTLTVTTSRPHQGRFLVRFEGVGSRDDAEALRDGILFGEAIEDDGALFVHELIGSQVVDLAGNTHGVVTGVEANPASDLLVIDHSVLCPLTFVVAQEPGRLVVDAPEGIF